MSKVIKLRTLPPATHQWLDGKLILSLPLPDRKVSPNARRGQSRGAAIVKSKAIKLHRLRAKFCALSARVANDGPFIPTGYSLSFHWPTRAFRDDDNADASCKSYRDGIAEAFDIDDRSLRKSALSTHNLDKNHPHVQITLHE